MNLAPPTSSAATPATDLGKRAAHHPYPNGQIIRSVRQPPGTDETRAGQLGLPHDPLIRCAASKEPVLSGLGEAGGDEGLTAPPSRPSYPFRVPLVPV